jgi:hypothetical protein
MIRGPVLPQTRDSLWSLVSPRLDLVESGLTLVSENFDCSDGALGAIEGLARDAVGGPVLVLLAIDGDALLPSRALAAGRFLVRVGDALAAAMPEACFCPKAPGRVLLIGTDGGAALDKVYGLPIESLVACTLEPFRVAGGERFAVRWRALPDAAPRGAAADSSHDDWSLGDGGSFESDPGARSSAPGYADPEFFAPAASVELWDAVQSLCARLDPAVVLRGDRYARHITWNGQPLGTVRAVGSSLVASAATGVIRELHDAADVRRFGDQLMRAFAQHARLGLGGPREPEQGPRTAGAGADRTATARQLAGLRQDVAERGAAADAVTGDEPGESLRSSLAASRLSPEEHSALGGSASSADLATGASVAEERPKASSPTDRSAGRPD